MTDTLDGNGVELKPCPFCGASLQRQQTSSGHWYEHMGEVEDCYATGSIIFDENIAAWNRRAPLASSHTAVEPVAYLKRWSFERLTGGVTLLPVVRADGEWVRFEDVAALRRDEGKGVREAALEALRPFAEAFTKADDPGVSDLYDEQPFSLHVTLGAWRRLRSVWRALAQEGK